MGGASGKEKEGGPSGPNTGTDITLEPDLEPGSNPASGHGALENKVPENNLPESRGEETIKQLGSRFQEIYERANRPTDKEAGPLQGCVNGALTSVCDLACPLAK